MKYQCKVIINANLEKVIELFLEHMVQNKELKVGNETIFSYDINEHHVLVMKETIESINLPYEIVQFMKSRMFGIVVSTALKEIK